MRTPQFDVRKHKRDLRLPQAHTHVLRSYLCCSTPLPELNITINIFDAERGSFELYDEETGGEDWYAEGGLWFNGKDLIDYDGVFALPKVIENKLTEMGYNLEDI